MKETTKAITIAIIGMILVIGILNTAKASDNPYEKYQSVIKEPEVEAIVEDILEDGIGNASFNELWVEELHANETYIENMTVYNITGNLTATTGIFDYIITKDLTISDGFDNKTILLMQEEANQTTVPSLNADIVPDCIIDIFDLATVGSCWSCESGQDCWATCYIADIVSNNDIDIFDLAAVGLAAGNTCNTAEDRFNMEILNSTGTIWSGYTDVGNSFSISTNIEDSLIKSAKGDMQFWSIGGDIIMKTLMDGDIVLDSSGTLRPSITDTLDFGTSDYKYRDFYISGQIMGGSPVNFLEGIEIRESGQIPYIQSNISEIYINSSINVSENITSPMYCIENDCITEWGETGSGSGTGGLVAWRFEDERFMMQVS